MAAEYSSILKRTITAKMGMINQMDYGVANLLAEVDQTQRPSYGIILASNEQIRKFGFADDSEFPRVPGADIVGEVEISLYDHRLGDYLEMIRRRPGMGLVRTGYTPAIVRNGISPVEVSETLTDSTRSIDTLVTFSAKNPQVSLLVLNGAPYLIKAGEKHDIEPAEDTYSDPVLVA